MSQVTVELIKELRDRTGVGMGKCKEALKEANGDIEQAIANLRKAGIAQAVKKEGREANEGMIVAAQNDEAIALVEVNAETDFVVKNERFQAFAKEIAEEALKSQPSSLEEFLSQKSSKDPEHTIDGLRAILVQTIGENIQIGRVKILKKEADHSYGIYSHMGGKILTFIDIQGSSDVADLAKEIALHAAACDPDYLSPEQVPAEVIEKEKEIIKEQVKGKPEHILDKIVEGKLNAFYEQICLTHQKFVKDESLTINQLLENKSKEIGKPLSIVNFVLWKVGQSS